MNSRNQTTTVSKTRAAPQGAALHGAAGRGESRDEVIFSIGNTLIFVCFRGRVRELQVENRMNRLINDPD